MSYIENLKRLGIIEIPENINLNQDKTTKEMLNVPNVKQEIEKLDREKGNHTIYFKLIKLSEYGAQFVNACVIEHDLFRKKI